MATTAIPTASGILGRMRGLANTLRTDVASRIQRLTPEQKAQLQKCTETVTGQAIPIPGAAADAPSLPTPAAATAAPPATVLATPNVSEGKPVSAATVTDALGGPSVVEDVTPLPDAAKPPTGTGTRQRRMAQRKLWLVRFR